MAEKRVQDDYDDDDDDNPPKPKRKVNRLSSDIKCVAVEKYYCHIRNSLYCYL